MWFSRNVFSLQLKKKKYETILQYSLGKITCGDRPKKKNYWETVKPRGVCY